MKLSDPPIRYDQKIQRTLQHTVEQADEQNRKKGADIEVHPARLILRAPNGSRWMVQVSNGGILSTVALP